MRLWVRLLDDTPPIRLISSTGPRTSSRKTKARKPTWWAQPSSLGRLDEAARRFEQSLAVQPDWPNHGLNAYGLALAHHRLGHPALARHWLDVADRWLERLDKIYAIEAPRS